MSIAARAALMAMLAGAAIAVPASAEEVSFTSLDGTQLNAHVFQPAQAPRGTVVALHGCGGLYASAGPRRGLLSARHQMWADLLAADGYAVVFPDSLGPRGEAELCSQPFRNRRVTQVERRADALGAMNWSASQSWGQNRPVVLLGWSHGGSAVLAATDGSRRLVSEQPVQPALAIAFYPGCSVFLKTGYRPNTRLALLLGEKDDWTPPGPCVELGQAASADVQVYADSHHGFDSPAGNVRLLQNVPNGVNRGQGVHVGRNPEAARQSIAHVRELLAEVFK